MFTDPQDPQIPKLPGEPNSEVEPRNPNEAKPQLPEKAPTRPAGSGDYISEMRKSMAREEAARLKRARANRRTGNLIQRLTGSLRRVTGTLRDTGSLSNENTEPAPRPLNPDIVQKLPTGRLTNQPQQEISDELLTGRLDSAQAQVANSKRVTGRLGNAQAPEGDKLLTGRLGSEPAQKVSSDHLTGRLGTAPLPEVTDDLLTGRLGSSLGPQISGDHLTGRLGTAPLPEVTDDLLTGRLGSAPGPQVSGDHLTGRLGTTPLPEVTDDLLTGKLDSTPVPGIADNHLTGRLGTEPLPEVTDDLLTGQLNSVPGPENTGDHLTGGPGTLPLPEITDDFLTGRLEGTSGSDIAGDHLTGSLATTPLPEISNDLLAGRPGITPVDERQSIPLPESWIDLPDADIEATELLEMEEEPLPNTEVEPGIIPGGDVPMSFVGSGDIAASGMAQEAKAQGDETDWVKEIREEAAQDSESSPQPWPEQPAGEQQALNHGRTSQLSDFISSIFGRPGEKRGEPDEAVISDELVAGRLERSLGTEAEETPTDENSEFRSTPVESVLDEQFPEAFSEPTLNDETDILDPQIVQEKDKFFEGLEVNFSNVGEVATGEENHEFELYPEDEELLWGNPSQAPAEPIAPDVPITPEEVWQSETDSPGNGSDLRREIWGEAEERVKLTEEIFPPVAAGKPNAEDYYAATFLTGEDYLSPIEKEPLPDSEELMGKLLSNSPATAEPASVQNLRAIALENYEERAHNKADYSKKIHKKKKRDEHKAATAKTAADTKKVKREQEQLRFEAEEETRRALSTNWKTWLVNRKTSQKILLGEAVIVLTALLFAVPFFAIMILRGPSNAARQSQPITLPIRMPYPADTPYPTGLTLPGGWYFPLKKSTLTNGTWQPGASEWLEGTEPRRVVSLPWNPQIEAVIKTFQAGDEFELNLSNHDTLKYRFFSVEQVAANNTQVYSDRNPSLAIILYRAGDPNRWVVICKP